MSEKKPSPAAPPRRKGAVRSSDYGLPCRPLPEKARELADFDYADKLSPADRAWLAEFSRAYYLDSREPAQHLTPEQRAQILRPSEESPRPWSEGFGSSRQNEARRRDRHSYARAGTKQSYEDIQERAQERQDEAGSGLDNRLAPGCRRVRPNRRAEEA